MGTTPKHRASSCARRATGQPAIHSFGGACSGRSHLPVCLEICAPAFRHLSFSTWFRISGASHAASKASAKGSTPSTHSIHFASRRSEEHTSELQSPCNLVCRLLLEKKKKNNISMLPSIQYCRQPLAVARVWQKLQ